MDKLLLKRNKTITIVFYEWFWNVPYIDSTENELINSSRKVRSFFPVIMLEASHSLMILLLILLCIIDTVLIRMEIFKFAPPLYMGVFHGNCIYFNCFRHNTYSFFSNLFVFLCFSSSKYLKFSMALLQT